MSVAEDMSVLHELHDCFPEAVLRYHQARTDVTSEELSGRRTALIQFFLICRDSSKTQVASQPADELWHDFILHTTEYREYCGHLGGFVEHLPMLATAPSGYLTTRALAEKRFGPLSPSAWPPEERLFWSVGRFRPERSVRTDRVKPKVR